MDRRSFMAAVAAAALSGRPVLAETGRSFYTLEAVYGPRLPEMLVIAAGARHRAGSGVVVLSAPRDFPGFDPDHIYFELRTYEGSSRSLAELHRRLTVADDGLCHQFGIEPVLCETGAELRYLLGFKSLAERSAAWTRFNASPEWECVRRRTAFSVTGLTIYRIPANTPTNQEEGSLPDRCRSQRPESS